MLRTITTYSFNPLDSLGAYICHILDGQGKAMMALQMVMEDLVAS